MRKRIILLLSLFLALTVSLAIFAGCSKVTVEISKETLEVTTGKTGTLSATATNGSEILWLTSDETIATVEDGKVTGIKEGTATITAKAKKGKGSATCEVTVKDPVLFTFKDDSGDVITKLQIDRNGPSVQLSATASDGSKVTRWASSDESIVSVTSTGLATALFDGEVTLTAYTSTGAGTLKVTVIDTWNGEKYTITDTASASQWYYWVEHADVTDILRAEVRDGITFGFNGGNWFHNSIQLFYKGEALWEHYFHLTATIEADFEGTVTINGTRVVLHEGTNNISVRYLYYSFYDYAFQMQFGNSKASLVESGTIKITNLNWEPFEEAIDLETPSFTLDGDEIIITDQNPEVGVDEYKIGLFSSIDDDKPVFVQLSDSKEVTLDVSKMEDSGTYYVKVMAVGNPCYNDSGWSDTEHTYTVNNTDVTYEIPLGGGSDAMAGSGWYYYVVDGGSVLGIPEYENGTLTLQSGYLGWAFYSTQIFRHYAMFENKTELLISMKIDASHAGTVTISGTIVELKAGLNQIYVKTTQSGDAATINMQFGYVDGSQYGAVNFPLDTEITFIFSDIEVTEYVATYLEAVSGTVNSENKKVTVTDNNEAGVQGYELGFFKNGTLMKTVALGADGTFSDTALTDGVYALRIRAVATDVRYISADWTEISSDYEVANGGATYTINFGGDSDKPNAISDINTWYYWNDQNWTGSTVTINKAEVNKDVVTIDYAVNAGSSDWGIQLYYKNPLIGGDNKLTLKINSLKAINVTINGASFALNEGDNDLTVYYSQGGSYSFTMQVKVDAGEVDANTLVISDIVYQAYTYINLTAPVLTVSEDGNVSITDSSASDNVSGYVLGYFTEGAVNPIAKVAVTNGGKLDVSMVDSGNYTLKVMAIAADNRGYKDSAWSAGFAYTVVNDGGARYDLDTDFGGGTAGENPGRWGCWADQWWTGSGVTIESATYANKEVTISFTSSGTSPYGLQINYVNPNYTAGTRYSFDIVATEDMDIQVEDGGAAVTHLVAGQKVTLTGGTDASFYIQVNIKNGVSGTLTISNIEWK